MLFSNVAVSAEERTFDFGKIWQLSVGEKGRGRKLLSLTCPPQTKLAVGMNQDYTIGLTKSGKPRIFRMDQTAEPDRDYSAYMLLSSQGGYTRRGNGRIFVLKNQREEIQVLAEGNGADGDAGRIGWWSVKLLKPLVSGDLVIRCRLGGTAGTTMVVVTQNLVYSSNLENYYDMCDHLGVDGNLFEYNPDGFNKDEWVEI